MHQEIAMDWTVFGLTLAALFIFGINYALFVNWMAHQKVSGQTAYIVVVGVAVALMASAPTFGPHVIAIMFSYFAACGTPMVIEYGIRVHKARRKDEEAAQALAKEAIQEGIANDKPT